MGIVAVVGAGNGGLAVAGLLASRGHEVRVTDRNPEVVEPIARAGAIEVTGKIQGRGPVALATTDVAAAVRGAPVVMVVVPGNAHGAVAEALAPSVSDGQVIVLHPGGAGGALEFAATFARLGVRARPLLAEVESFTYGSKTVGPARTQINTIKLRNRVAALPARDTGAVLAALRDDFPQFVPARTVLETSLNHMNAMLHVATMVMNAGWIEATKGDFEFYRDGLSPAVARMIEAVDAERIAVSTALGAGALPLREWIKETYGVEGPTLYETMQTLNATVYKTSKAPASLASRYLTEDVPTGLVPIAALGAAAGAAVPLIRLLVDLASRIHGVDYWESGRTLAKMGLAGRLGADIVRIVEDDWPEAGRAIMTQMDLRMATGVERGRPLHITMDGQELLAYQGESVAAALFAAGRRATRATLRAGEPRGYFCGMGVCQDCLVTVDDQPNVRACMTSVRDGLRVATQRGWGQEEAGR
jgi:opine dehydrogenase